MDTATSFTALGIALGLGLLVGMQRERAGSRRAGSRTFPLITLLGSVCALLTDRLGAWPVAAGFVGVIATVVVSNVAQTRADAHPHVGMTTEIAMLVMYGVGTLCVLAPWEIATAVGGVVLVLLHAKDPLHALAARLGDQDVRAIVRFALISLVILPVLPDRVMGPLDALNPRRIWLVVVLVVGIGLAAYVARRVLGSRLGSLVGGLLGGLVSSTATTAGISRSVAKGLPVAEGALIAAIASAMVVPRQLLEIAAIAPRALADLAMPLLTMLVAFTIPIAIAWRRAARQQAFDVPASSNPAELGPAVLFGLIFALVLLGVALALEQFGNRGLYVVALLSGTTDVDAITISTASLMREGRVEPVTGTRTILIASLANLAGKAGIAGALGGASMFRATALVFALPVLAGLLWITLT